MIQLYWYWEQGGIANIFVVLITRILSALFTVSFIFMVSSMVYWKDGFSGALSKEGRPILHYPSEPVGIAWCVCLGLVLLMGIISCWFSGVVGTALHVRRYCRNKLDVSDTALASMPLDLFIRHVLRQDQMVLGRSQMKDEDLLAMMTRHTNYMVLLRTLKVIDPKLPKALSFVPTPITNIYDWMLQYAMSDLFEKLFDPEFKLDDLGSQSAKLSSRIWWTGFLALVLSPFILVAFLLYIMITSLESLRNTPGIVFSRAWSPYALWSLRGFDETSSQFNDRLAKAFDPATMYFSQFKSSAIITLARFLVFVLASLSAPLVILAFWKPELLSSTLLWKGSWERPILFGFSLLLTMLAFVRALVPGDSFFSDPGRFMGKVLKSLSLPFLVLASIPEAQRDMQEAREEEIRQRRAELMQKRVAQQQTGTSGIDPSNNGNIPAGSKFIPAIGVDLGSSAGVPVLQRNPSLQLSDDMLIPLEDIAVDSGVAGRRYTRQFSSMKRQTFEEIANSHLTSKSTDGGNSDGSGASSPQPLSEHDLDRAKKYANNVQWQRYAHTPAVRREFELFFQAKLWIFLSELLSILTTPIVFMTYLYNQNLEITSAIYNNSLPYGQTWSDECKETNSLGIVMKYSTLRRAPKRPPMIRKKQDSISDEGYEGDVITEEEELYLEIPQLHDRQYYEYEPDEAIHSKYTDSVRIKSGFFPNWKPEQAPQVVKSIIEEPDRVHYGATAYRPSTISSAASSQQNHNIHPSGSSSTLIFSSSSNPAQRIQSSMSQQQSTQYRNSSNINVSGTSNAALDQSSDLTLFDLSTTTSMKFPHGHSPHPHLQSPSSSSGSSMNPNYGTSGPKRFLRDHAGRRNTMQVQQPSSNVSSAFPASQGRYSQQGGSYVPPFSSSDGNPARQEYRPISEFLPADGPSSSDGKDVDPSSPLLSKGDQQKHIGNV